MKLSEAIEQYMLDCKVNNLSKNTINSYTYHLGNFINAVHDIPVADLSPNHIRIYIAGEMERNNSHTGEPLSSYSLNKGYCVIRSFCNWLASQGIIRESPTDKTKPPRIGKDLPDALTKKELLAVFDYLDTRNFRDKVIFEFFLDTGCRLNEVVNLNLNDVHINEGWAKIQGKGDKEAIVPMGDRLCRDLHIYITRFRKAPPNEEALFVSTVAPHRRFSRDGLSTMVKRVHKACGIEGKQGAHKLRHTMATQYIANGGDIAILRRILRHTHISTTQRYINLVQNDIQEAHHQFSPLDNLGRSKQ